MNRNAAPVSGFWCPIIYIHSPILGPMDTGVACPSQQSKNSLRTSQKFTSKAVCLHECAFTLLSKNNGTPLF